MIKPYFSQCPIVMHEIHFVFVYSNFESSRENEDVNQYTVNVREMNGQTNFFVREETPFKTLSSLLTFYKRNKFQTCSLRRPVSSERVILRRCGKEVEFMNHSVASLQNYLFINLLLPRVVTVDISDQKFPVTNPFMLIPWGNPRLQTCPNHTTPHPIHYIL